MRGERREACRIISTAEYEKSQGNLQLTKPVNPQQKSSIERSNTLPESNLVAGGCVGAGLDGRPLDLAHPWHRPVDPQGADADPRDPRLEVDPQICATDTDCMIGTPRDCCTGFCPEHRQAWSRAAWAAYQDDCAVTECASPERLACQPEHDTQRDAVAVCVRERCVLR